MKKIENKLLVKHQAVLHFTFTAVFTDFIETFVSVHTCALYTRCINNYYVKIDIRS
jgi:hypothetical protein